MKQVFSAIALAAALLAAPAYAQQSQGGHDAHHPAALSDGEVRKVDKDAKKITIKPALSSPTIDRNAIKSLVWTRAGSPATQPTSR